MSESGSHPADNDAINDAGESPPPTSPEDTSNASESAAISLSGNSNMDVTSPGVAARNPDTQQESSSVARRALSVDMIRQLKEMVKKPGDNTRRVQSTFTKQVGDRYNEAVLLNVAHKMLDTSKAHPRRYDGS